MNTQKFYGEVKDNKLVTEHRESMQQHIESLNGKHIEIKINIRKLSRSENQNRYYWGVIIPTLKKELKTDRVHSILKHRFLSETFSYNGPEYIEYIEIKSLNDLTLNEFKDYINYIISWSFGQGIIIPTSNYKT